MEALEGIPLHSYYYENVFSVEDLYLYRAVFHFFAGEYRLAIEGYELCQRLKMGEGGKVMQAIDDNTASIRAYSHSSTPMLSMNSSKTDLSDVGLCSLNVHETNFNILLCHLMLGDHAQALTKLNDLINEAPGKY